MSRFLLLLAAVGALIAGSLAPAVSEEPATKRAAGCDAFVWPLETERAWFKAPDVIPLKSGDKLATPPGDKAISLRLRPASSIELPAPPTSTPKLEDAKRFAGVVHFDGLPEGHYQIALSDHGWLDVVQEGKALESTGHTGSPDCDELRKSVRFEIGAAPFAVQVSGARADTIRIAIRPAAD